MAGRSNTKNLDNFEKIKREMTTKRQKAEAQNNDEVIQLEEIDDTLTIDSKINDDINKQDETVESNDKSFYEEKKIEMVVFRVGEEEFAFRISDVKEIIRIPDMNKVPNAPSYVVGLCTIRGFLLPVIDIRKLIGMIDQEQSDNSRIVIVDINGKMVGLITDGVSEVISIEKSKIKEPPSSIKGTDDGVINGILLLNKGERVIMVLDTAKMIKVGKLKEVFNEEGFLKGSIESSNTKSIEEEQIIIFYVGNEEYTFSIDNVKEIIRLPDTSKVPHRAEYIEGVFSLRNQLLTVINLGMLLGIDCKEPDEYSRVIILNTGQLIFGVIVDKVSQVMRVQKDSFQKSNLFESGTQMGYSKGFFNLNNGKRLVMLLEANKLISIDDVNNVTNFNNQKNVGDSIRNMDEIYKVMEKIVIFKLDTQEYGIKINNVKEINRISEIAHFPGAPSFIDGMVNLRGNIIPVLNLRKLFGFKNISTHEFSKFLVVEYENRTIGIIIDSASEVMEFSKTSVEEVSKTFNGTDEIRCIESIVKLNEGKRNVLLLNLASVLSFL